MTPHSNGQHPIRLIAVDIDHTLLTSQHQLSPRTEQALRAALADGVQLVLATGKTYRSAVDLIQRLELSTPGIFSQGTVIANPDGSVRSQQALDPALARQVITYAEDRGYSIALYCGNRILVRRRNPRIDYLHTRYGEPPAEAVGALQNVLDLLPVNKLIAFTDGDARAITALRWQLGMQVNGSARLLQAGVSDMLEVLPPGASKGAALKALLRDLNIAPENVLAVGDAENDIEMLQLAGMSAAVANASPTVKAVAKAVVASHDEDGVAEAVERWVLQAATAASETESR